MNSKLSSDQISGLVKRLRLGDESAFKQFFQSFYPSIFHFIYRYLFDYEIAKDLSQDTFMKFWINRENIDPDLSPKTYLFRIARNLAINHIDRLPKITDLVGKEEILIQHCNNPEKDYELDFVINDFKKAVIYLPERCRVIFMLSRFHNFSYEEIAETLEISLQTVKNQMNKAIAILRKSLQDHID